METTEQTLPPEVEPAGQEAAGKKGDALWRDWNFNIFWVGQTFDALGDSYAKIVIPLLVLEITGSVTQMGLITATIGAGAVLAGIISGNVIDRVDRRKLMIACDVVRTVLYGLIPLCWWLFGAEMWFIYALMLPISFLTATFLITYTASIPSLVDREQIGSANGRLQSTVALAYVAGPMLAGFAAALLTPIRAIGMVAVTYLVASVLMALVRLRRAPESEGQAARAGERTSAFSTAQLVAGVRFLLAHPALKSVTLLLMLFTFVSGAAVDLTIYRLKTTLQQDDNTIGLVFGMSSLGAIAAGILAPMLRRMWGFGVCFLGGLLLQAVAIAAIGFIPAVFAIGALCTLYMFALTVRNVSSMTLRQQVTPDHLLGRVSSALWTMMTVLGPFGSALGAVLAARLGASVVLAILGVLGLVIAAAGFLTPAYNRRPEEGAALPAAGS